MLQFLAFKSPLKMVEHDIYLTLKALFVLKIFKFCPDFLVNVGKRLDKETKVYDVIT